MKKFTQSFFLVLSMILAFTLSSSAQCGTLANVAFDGPTCSDDGFEYSVVISYAGADADVTFIPSEGSNFPNGVSSADWPNGRNNFGQPLTFVWSSINSNSGFIDIQTENGAICRVDPFLYDNPNCEYAPIPTMGEWGIMILGMILLIFGVVAVRQTTLSTARA